MMNKKDRKKNNMDKKYKLDPYPLAEWYLDMEDNLVCSGCNKLTNAKYLQIIDDVVLLHDNCPNCGRKMKNGGEDYNDL